MSTTLQQLHVDAFCLFCSRHGNPLSTEMARQYLRNSATQGAAILACVSVTIADH